MQIVKLFALGALALAVACRSNAEQRAASAELGHQAAMAIMLTDYAWTHSPADVHPQLADCKLMSFPWLPVMCDGFSLTLWHHPSTDELWVAETGSSIGGRSLEGRWFGPIQRDDPLAANFEMLFPWSTEKLD